MSSSSQFTHEFDLVGESKKTRCGAKHTDTDACYGGSTAGHVDVWCQSFEFESDLHESSQFDETVLNSEFDKPVDESSMDIEENRPLGARQFRKEVESCSTTDTAG